LISDFDINEDIIDFGAVEGITSIDSLQIESYIVNGSINTTIRQIISETGGHASSPLTTGVIFLHGVDSSSLNESHFSFDKKNISDDIYVYQKGDGNEIISDYFGNNSLMLEAITIDEVSISRDRNDVILTIDSTGETITLIDQLSAINITSITFSDGIQWTHQTLAEYTTLIEGTDTDDTLSGTAYVDLIDGGKGDDVLEGQEGADKYYYEKGDGNDIIHDFSGSNSLIFWDINANEVTASRNGSDAIITINSTDETITLDHQFFWSSMIGSITFADGTQWSHDNIAEYASWIQGTNSDDTLSGTSDVDRFDGGKGDDVLSGSSGNDEYYYEKGDGNDIIDDSSGSNRLILRDINANEVSASRNGSDAIININSTGETITLDHKFFWSSMIGSITFSDGTQWSHDNIAEYASWIQGAYSDDTLSGTSDVDRFDGGKGDDVLSCSSGIDEYYYEKWDGNDIIDDSSGSNRLILRDINANEVSASRNAYDAIITINSTGETITLHNQFFWDSVINTVTFSDDTQWSHDNISEYASWVQGTNSDDTLSGTSDIDRIDGGEGDDVLSGLGGNDAFVFSEDFGADIVSDFTEGDIIEFTNNTFDSYAAVLSSMVEDGQDVIITLDADNSVTLSNVAISDLQADDFRFV
jgi:Ca2+-binding RTX toxin-like protein